MYAGLLSSVMRMAYWFRWLFNWNANLLANTTLISICLLWNASSNTLGLLLDQRAGSGIEASGLSVMMALVCGV